MAAGPFTNGPKGPCKVNFKGKKIYPFEMGIVEKFFALGDINKHMLFPFIGGSHMNIEQWTPFSEVDTQIYYYRKPKPKNDVKN